MKVQIINEWVRAGIVVTIGFVVSTAIFSTILAVKESHAAGGIIVRTDTGGRVVVDLNNPIDREVFRKEFAEDPKVSGCFKRADWGVKLMNERDAGTTSGEHLQKVEAQYEKTKLAPEGAVPWHVYIDFGRTVRDIHRSAGSSAKGEYRYTDADEVWVREFRWCAVGH